MPGRDGDQQATYLAALGAGEIITEDLQIGCPLQLGGRIERREHPFDEHLEVPPTQLAQCCGDVGGPGHAVPSVSSRAM